MRNHCFNRYIDYLSSNYQWFIFHSNVLNYCTVCSAFPISGKIIPNSPLVDSRMDRSATNTGVFWGIVPMNGRKQWLNQPLCGKCQANEGYALSGWAHPSGFIGHSFCLDSHGMDHTDHTPWILCNLTMADLIHFGVICHCHVPEISWELPTSGTFTVAAAHSGIAGTIHCTPAVELAGNVDPGLTGA